MLLGREDYNNNLMEIIKKNM